MAMGRKTILDAAIQRDICDVLSIGGTVEDACARVSIAPQTFYNWCNRGTKKKAQIYVDFLEAVTRAQGAARINAVIAIRTAVMGTDATNDDTETISETRLRRGENGEQVPYDYTKTVRRKSTTHIPPDWRAAVEYLKRRDSKNWSDRLQLDVNVNVQLLIDTVKALNDANIDATEFFEKAKQRAEAKRLSGG